MITDYIIVPLSGALIGYCTNWLAIKMLFRPHYEKRIFNIKIPFTPGLIPKERYKLAKKIGETVEDHILTKDILIKTLLSESSGESIKILVDENFELISRSNMTISDCCEKVFRTTKEENKEALENILLKTVKYLKNEHLIYDITEVISLKIIDTIKLFDVSKQCQNTLDYTKYIFKEKGVSYLTSQQFTEFMSDKTKKLYDKAFENENHIGMYFDEETITKFKNILKDSIPSLAEKFKTTFDNSELDKYLKDLTCKVVEDSVGKFAIMFVNKDKIYETIKKNAITFLEDEKSYDIIYDKLEELLQKVLGFSVCEVIKNVSYESVEKISSSLVQSIQESSTDDLVIKILEYFSNYIEKQKDINLYSLIARIEPRFEMILKEFISSMLDSFLKNEGTLFLEKQCEYFAEKIMHYNVNFLVSKLDQKSQTRIKASANILLNNLIEKGAEYFLSRLSISKVIEDQLNNFEVDEGEKIVLSVVKRELNVITALGGIIGFVLGLLTLAVK